MVRRFTCPRCGKQWEVNTPYAANVADCPTCGAYVVAGEQTANGPRNDDKPTVAKILRSVPGCRATSRLDMRRSSRALL